MYKGYDLFNDIEDKALQARNRAVVMANMIEPHVKDGRLTERGTHLALGYFGSIPEEDRKALYKAFEQQCKDRGYVRRPQ